MDRFFKSFSVCSRGQPPVFIMGGTSVGLGFVRSLGRRGIPVYVLDSKPLPPGMYSRYGHPTVLPDIMEHPEAWRDFLVRNGSKIAEKAVLIPTGDIHVLFVSRYRACLEKHFLFRIPDALLATTLCNKKQQYGLLKSLGVNIPKTIYSAEGDDVPERVSEHLGYPCVLKPHLSHSWQRRHTGVKAFMASTPDELKALGRKVSHLHGGFIIQEMIPGADENLYFFMSYFNRDCDPLAGFVARKLRQHPPFFGNGSLIISSNNKEIEDLSVSLLRRLSYQGHVGIEYKWDHRDRQFKLIEINMRSVASIQHAVDCGIDFPYLSYLDLTGRKQEKYARARAGDKFVHLAWDIQALLAYRKLKLLSVLAWIKSLRGVRSFALFSFSDPRPFLSMGVRFLQNKILRLV